MHAVAHSFSDLFVTDGLEEVEDVVAWRVMEEPHVNEAFITGPSSRICGLEKFYINNPCR